MLDVSALRKGLKFQIDGAPFIVVQFQFVKPGKGQALYKCRLKNMLTGVQADQTFRSGDKFEEANLEETEMEYLYAESDTYCFMDTSTYAQEFLTEDQIEEVKGLLKENTVCSVLLFDGRPIGVTLPNFIDLQVAESEPWAKGDTASGSTKPVTLETGLTIQVPPFIEEGEVIRIDTRTVSYVERVKSE